MIHEIRLMHRILSAVRGMDEPLRSNQLHRLDITGHKRVCVSRRECFIFSDFQQCQVLPGRL